MQKEIKKNFLKWKIKKCDKKIKIEWEKRKWWNRKCKNNKTLFKKTLRLWKKDKISRKRIKKNKKDCLKKGEEERKQKKKKIKKLKSMKCYGQVRQESWEFKLIK